MKSMKYALIGTLLASASLSQAISTGSMIRNIKATPKAVYSKLIENPSRAVVDFAGIDSKDPVKFVTYFTGVSTLIAYFWYLTNYKNKDANKFDKNLVRKLFAQIKANPIQFAAYKNLICQTYCWFETKAKEMLGTRRSEKVVETSTTTEVGDADKKELKTEKKEVVPATGLCKVAGMLFPIKEMTENTLGMMAFLTAFAQFLNSGDLEQAPTAK
jgi:hypothetical protein